MTNNSQLIIPEIIKRFPKLALEEAKRQRRQVEANKHFLQRQNLLREHNQKARKNLNLLIKKVQKKKENLK